MELRPDLETWPHRARLVLAPSDQSGLASICEHSPEATKFEVGQHRPRPNPSQIRACESGSHFASLRPDPGQVPNMRSFRPCRSLPNWNLAKFELGRVRYWSKVETGLDQLAQARSDRVRTRQHVAFVEANPDLELDPDLVEIGRELAEARHHVLAPSWSLAGSSHKLAETRRMLSERVRMWLDRAPIRPNRAKCWRTEPTDGSTKTRHWSNLGSKRGQHLVVVRRSVPGGPPSQT